MSDVTHKLVDGELVELTPEEIAELEVVWAKASDLQPVTKPAPEPKQ